MRQNVSYCEKVTRDPGSSISLLHRRLDDEIPFQWHHHPEYELTLTLNSRGQRFIGDHVASYGDGDLVLIGPNLPHTWFSQDKITARKPHLALVVWFRPEWMEQLTQDCIEFSPIQKMLARAGRGLRFTGSTAVLREKFERLFVSTPAERLLNFLTILHELASQKGEQLASHGPLPLVPRESHDRIDRILTHVHAHYVQPIRLEELACLAALSPSALHRLFLKHTGKTISNYLGHLRIGDACGRLNGTNQPINFIAEAVGYFSLANFNRQFRTLKGMTPREYRKLFSPSTATARSAA